MFGKNSVGFILGVLLISGCARPKYIRESNPQNQNQAPIESKADCQTSFLKTGFCLTWSWIQTPTTTEKGSFVFKTYRLNVFDQTPIEMDLVGSPRVVLWMPSMGHGSLPTKTTQVDVGTYQVTDVFFVMPGDWEIRFQVNNGTEVIDETHINLVF